MTSSERPQERAAGRHGRSASQAPEPDAHPWHVTGLRLAVILSAFAWSTHFVAEYTLPKMLMIQLGVFLAAAGAWRAAPSAWRTPVDFAVVVNVGALVLCALFSVDWRTSLLGRYNSYSHGLWATGLYATLCLLAARLDRKTAASTTLWIVGAGALLAAYGVAQVLGYEPFLRAPLPAGNRAVSSIGSPVDLGAYLAALIPLAAACAFGRSKALGWAALACLAAGLASTGSRGAWLGTVVGLCVWAGLLVRGSGGRPAEALGKVPGWAWALGAALVLGAGALAAQRLAARPGGSTDSSRVEVWRAAWRIFAAKPVFGTGPDTFEAVFRGARSEEFVRRMKGSARFQAYAHNDLLQALSTTGIVGAGAYLYLVLVLALAALAAGRGPDAWLATGVAGGLAAVFTNVKFNPISVEVMTLVSVLCGLLVALSRPQADVPPGSPPPAADPSTRWWAGAAALASAGCLVLVLRFLTADLESRYAQIEFKRGLRPSGVEHIRRAMDLDPCNLAYRIQHMNEMGELINAEKTADARLALLAEALASGQKATACHPVEVNAHYLHGVAAWMHVQLGIQQYLELAEKELDRAVELDPLFIPLLEQRVLVARKRGPEAAAFWEARLAHARSLAPS